MWTITRRGPVISDGIYLKRIMKLLLSCRQCQLDNGKLSLHRVEVRDDGIYSITCSAGHETYFVLSAQKCEILFEIGANAIIDGYYREAVSSFASSLERFYEFCIRVMAQNSDFDSSKFAHCWAIVSNQSERQLGAFAFLWFYHFNEPPKMLSNSQVKFRNSVIHKGKIPKREEAVKFGDAVLAIVSDCIQKIQSDGFKDQIRNIRFDRLREQHSHIDPEYRVASMAIATILAIGRTDNVEHFSKPLDKHIQELESLRQAFKSLEPYVNNNRMY